MKIYFGHSKKFDFINEYYKPMEESEFLKGEKLIFPHSNDVTNKHKREFYASLDCFIAEVSYPALGLGVELGFASDENVPIYCFYRKGVKPNSTLKTLTDNIIEYSSLEELVSGVENVVKELKNSNIKEEIEDNLGKIIVLEGACDGIGKTTQYNMLLEHLKRDGEVVANHHFPSYGEYQGAPVEMYLRGGFGKQSELSPYFVNSLYAVDRGVTWHQELKKMYESGSTIVLDRYTTSSLIYQSCLIENLQEKKDFIDYVIDFEYQKIGIREPDRVIFLEADFDVVTKIRNERNKDAVEDIHESDKEFMRRAYDNAMFIADYLSWDKVSCSNRDGMRGKEEIHEDVYSLVKKRK